MKIFWQFLFTILSITNLLAQNDMAIQFPDRENWNVVSEGETLSFSLKATGGQSGHYTFSAVTDPQLDILLDKDGEFRWIPSYHLVNAQEKSKTFPVIFEVANEGGQVINRQVDFVVRQKTRLPAFTGLKPFYVKKDTDNTYEIRVGNAFRFVADNSRWQEGMQLTPGGVFRWSPSDEQYAQLRRQPVEIAFQVQDTLYGDQIPGKLQLIAIPQPEVAPNIAGVAPLRLLLPRPADWNTVNEGQTMSLQLQATGGTDQNYTFALAKGSETGVSFDTLGNFYWQPDFDFVDRLEETKTVPVIFEVVNASGETDKEQINLTVYHTNRPPEVEELKPFYVQYGVQNTYPLNGNAIRDPDNDPIVFKPVLSQMPQGMTLNGKGELSWKPSISQYYRLQKEPLRLEFLVEDQPHKAHTTGKLKVEVTQQDLPPDLSMVPNQDTYRIKEDETLNLKFYLSDPNGDQDITTFDFVTDNSRIPKSALVRNDPTQWEFVWTPGYSFFVEPGDTATYTLIFFVLDRANQRQEKQVRVTVEDAENLLEKDRLLYSQYRTGLVRIWNLMEQLHVREKELKRDYKRAKKGKKHRAITTASLGAVTGFSPVMLNNDPSAQKYVSGIGGTTSMTLGSLEASNVIGRDASGIFEKLSYINQKLTELETQGNVFAGKYALPNSRRSNDFSEDLRKLILTLSLKDVTTLELDAAWKNPKKSTDKNIQDAFKDFNPDESRSTTIHE